MRRRPVLHYLALTAFAALWMVCATLLMAAEGARPDYEGVFHVCVLLGQDPQTEATVLFQTSRSGGPGAVHYDSEPRGGETSAYRYHAAADPVRVPGLRERRYVHRVALSGLEPGRTYYFAAASPRGGVSEEFSFRTPAADGSLRFVEAGDTGKGYEGAELFGVAASYDPDFVVLGGDIAHGNGEFDNLYRWDRWFETWQRVMRASDGRLIPLASTIGNHEVNDRDHANPAERAPFFTTYFRDPAAPVYEARRFGDLLGLVLLDSDHLTSHAGPQREFLARTLASWQDVATSFAVYHKPFYPGHREFDGDGATFGRELWAPLFEQHGLTAAFEHHDHVLKRTVPLLAGAPAEDGVVYLGDGGLGQKARQAKPDRWYLAHTASAPHFWLVDVTPDGARCRAVGQGNRVLDEVWRSARTAGARLATR